MFAKVEGVMTRLSSLFCCAIALLAAPLVLAGQEPQPIFKSTVRTVPVYATVIDARR